MPAKLRKDPPLIRPVSISRNSPLPNSSAAKFKSRGMFKVRAESLHVPLGNIAIGGGAGIADKARTAEWTVPSPPAINKISAWVAAVWQAFSNSSGEPVWISSSDLEASAKCGTAIRSTESLVDAPALPLYNKTERLNLGISCALLYFYLSIYSH